MREYVKNLEEYLPSVMNAIYDDDDYIHMDITILEKKYFIYIYIINLYI